MIAESWGFNVSKNKQNWNRKGNDIWKVPAENINKYIMSQRLIIVFNCRNDVLRCILFSMSLTQNTDAIIKLGQ